MLDLLDIPSLTLHVERTGRATKNVGLLSISIIQSRVSTNFVCPCDISNGEVLENLTKITIIIVPSRMSIHQENWNIDNRQYEEQNCESLHGLQVQHRSLSQVYRGIGQPFEGVVFLTVIAITRRYINHGARFLDAFLRPGKEVMLYLDLEMPPVSVELNAPQSVVHFHHVVVHGDVLPNLKFIVGVRIGGMLLLNHFI